MTLSKKDLELLQEIEVELWNRKSENYFRMWELVERMMQQRDKTNAANYARIKEKRKTDKNYARPKRG